MYDLRDITFGIKTFMRPQALHRLLTSIRRFYPENRLVIVDDGDAPALTAADAAELPDGSQYIRLPFDSGLGVGRNTMIDAIRTPLTLYLDDDFVFIPESRLDHFVRILSGGYFDLVGGNVREWHKKRRFHGLLVQDGDVLHMVRGYRREQLFTDGVDTFPCREVDIVVNFFLAQTDRLRQIRWDSELKINTHLEFFLRARHSLRIGYTPQVVIWHEPLLPDEYMKYRKRPYREKALARHGIRKVVYSGKWQ